MAEVNEFDTTGLYLKQPRAAEIINVIMVVIGITVAVGFFSKFPIIILAKAPSTNPWSLAQRALAVPNWKALPYISLRRFINPALHSCLAW